MSSYAPQAEFQDRLKSIERLLGEIEAVADPNLRSSVQELLQLVMDLHGAGLERTLELIAAAPDGGEKMIQKLGRDELVSSLLILYGLHPESLEARLAQALDKVRSKLRTHEGEVELLGLQEGAVRLRLQARGQGCGSTPQALKEIVENVLYQGVPDMTSLVIEGAEEKQGFVPLGMLQKTSALENGLALSGARKGVA
jgi:Fe-S cluster biogenesis protein NfuA